jgi:hypothetical protein
MCAFAHLLLQLAQLRARAARATTSRCEIEPKVAAACDLFDDLPAGVIWSINQ